MKPSLIGFGSSAMTQVPSSGPHCFSGCSFRQLEQKTTEAGALMLQLMIALHELRALKPAQPPRLRIFEQRDNLQPKLLRIVRNMHARRPGVIESLKGHRSADDRQTESHGFQHFVLNSTSDTKGRHHERGPG